MSLSSCMAMSPATSQLSFVMTLSRLSSPFRLHCLVSSFQFFRSSRDPNAKHRRATGHLVLPPPSPSLRLSLPDVSLLLLQRCFCLIFFQSKKVVCKVLQKKVPPCLFPPALCMPWPTDTTPDPFPSLSASKCSFFIPNSSRF